MTNEPGINLLPEEGLEEEKTRERKKLWSLSAAGIFLVLLVLTLGSFAALAYFRSQDAAAQAKIDSSGRIITGLRSVEVLDRTVNSKLIRLQALLANYPQYSTILDDVAAFTPTGVTLTSLSFDSTGKLAVSGVAASPDAFGNFVNILRDPSTGGVKFSNVDIISASGGGKEGGYRFSLSMQRRATK